MKAIDSAKANIKEARASLKKIEAGLKKLEAQAIKSPQNWGISGSAGHIKAELQDIVNFLS